MARKKHRSEALFKSSSSVMPRAIRKPQDQILDGEFDYAKQLRSSGPEDFNQQPDYQLPRLLMQPKEKKNKGISRKTGLSSKFLTTRPAVSASPSAKTIENPENRQLTRKEAVEKPEKRRVPLKVVDGVTLLTADALVDLMTNSPHDETIFARDTPTKASDQTRIKQVTVPPVMEDSQTERLLERDYLMLDLRDDHVYKAYHIHDGRDRTNAAIHCPQMLINQDKYPPALFALVEYILNTEVPEELPNQTDFGT